MLLEQFMMQFLTEKYVMANNLHPAHFVVRLELKSIIYVNMTG